MFNWALALPKRSAVSAVWIWCHFTVISIISICPKSDESILLMKKRHTYQRINKKENIRTRFSKIEDKTLINLIQTYGTKSWILISKYMGTRSAHQCRGRWKSYLLPNIKNPPWTDEEDVLLEKYYQIYGNK